MKIRTLLNLVAISFVLFEIGCSQSETPQPQSTSSTQSGTPTHASISVTIEPQSLGIKRSDSWKFSAPVNAIDPTVNWSIQEGTAGGNLTNAGVYTAPQAKGIFHVVATSKADPSKTAIATVSVLDRGFAFTGSPDQPLYNHTATLLPNGQVYVAGGDSSSDYFTVALVDHSEIFDPTTSAFRPADGIAREAHTATLLQNGDVLFTGGIVGVAEPWLLTDSAEILKAGTTSLQPTGKMSIKRYFHTATLLPDGRVLITGGNASSESTITPTRTAEIYDPLLGTFTPVGNMSVPRQSHSAVLLSTGKVLITGGGSPELFDPATNSFMPTGTTSLAGSTTTLLADGRVLITSGSSTTPAQLYDPVTGQFSSTGTMTIERVGYTTSLLRDGKVLIGGGYTPVAGPTPGTSTTALITSTEIYNPATGSFEAGPTLREGRNSPTATVLSDGGVLLVGGNGPTLVSTPLASAEIFR